MPFPESQRVVYGRNPLAEVICQLRFPTVLRIGTSVPVDFQEKVREQYPLYSLQEAHALSAQLPKELSGVFEQIGLPKTVGPAIHRFSTRDSRRSISLCQDFLAIVDTQYSRWESFRDELRKAQDALREIYKPAFYTRIGLRYVDIISRTRLGLANVAWKDLIKQPIIGELGAMELSGEVTAIRTRSVIKVPELQGGQVRLIHGLDRLSDESNEDCYTIDADFFVENKEGLDDPFDVLDRFNRLAGRLFRWAITDTLHAAMEPRVL